MTWMYVAEVVVILAAAMLAGWLKEQGDRSWRIHQIIVRSHPVTLHPVVLRITADTTRFETAMREVVRATDELGLRIRNGIRESIPELRTPPEAHQCELPWTGSLHQCQVCGTWFHVVTFRDDDAGLQWPGWEPIDDEKGTE